MTVKKLCVGSGRAGETGPEWINVDAADFGNNVVWDLNRHPWPFADETFFEVKAIDVVEHLCECAAAISEIIRVARPGGLILIQVPHAAHARTWIDPGHKRGFMRESLDYWIRGNRRAKQYGELYHQGRFFITDLTVREQGANLVFRCRRAPAQKSTVSL
ncbi:MAG: methyltransferase domain-containing protein [Candidatus Lernaella stagnicola]|nr:methyltransferase domain-containing protein [Candidatus Lernaella stagnicola]